MTSRHHIAAGVVLLAASLACSGTKKTSSSTSAATTSTGSSSGASSSGGVNCGDVTTGCGAYCNEVCNHCPGSSQAAAKCQAAQAAALSGGSCNSCLAEFQQFAPLCGSPSAPTCPTSSSSSGSSHSTGSTSTSSSSSSSSGVIGCTTSSQCTGGNVCDTFSIQGGGCVPNCATSGTPCVDGGGAPLCDTDAGSPGYGVCFGCLHDSDCTVGSATICSAGQCVHCTTNAQCMAESSTTPFCNGLCVGCLTSADCHTAGTACSTFNSQCEPFCVLGGPSPCPPCSQNSDCPASDPVCNSTGTCVPSNFDAGQVMCGSVTCDSSQVCDTSTNTCVGCLSTADCHTPQAPICDTTAKACVQCRTPSDCPYSTPGCSGNVCGTCTTTANCPSPMTCDTNFGVCACAASSDCGGDAPVCR